MEGGRRSLSSRGVDCLLKSVVSRQARRSIVTVVVSPLVFCFGIYSTKVKEMDVYGNGYLSTGGRKWREHQPC